LHVSIIHFDFAFLSCSIASERAERYLIILLKGVGNLWERLGYVSSVDGIS